MHQRCREHGGRNADGPEHDPRVVVHIRVQLPLHEVVVAQRGLRDTAQWPFKGQERGFGSSKSTGIWVLMKLAQTQTPIVHGKMGGGGYIWEVDHKRKPSKESKQANKQLLLGVRDLAR